MRPDLRRHAILVCAEIANEAGAAVEDLEPEIFLAEEEERELDQILRRHGLPLEGFAILNPFSRWRSRLWPLDRHARLVRRLRKDLDAPIVVTGGPAETEQAAELAGLLGPQAPVSLVGRLSLGQAFGLYRRARLMITCDTGPMHAAAAGGTPVVALFGPTLPERTGPWGEHHRVIQARRPPFHHMYKWDAGGAYMGAIDVDTVHEAAVESWERSRGRKRGSARFEDHVRPLRSSRAERPADPARRGWTG